MADLISDAQDLVTTHEATVNGFLDQMKAKNERAEPYLQEAREFSIELQSVDTVNELVEKQQLRDKLLYFAGLSTKAMGHLSEDELKSILERALRDVADRDPEDWRDEILHRFLLIRGDSLGGSMRNLTGSLAGAQFSEAVITALNEKGMKYDVDHSTTNSDKITAIKWKDRELVFDKNSPISGNNIDAILLDAVEAPTTQERLQQPKAYVAAGELKGGIDPAGADEHWKTADTALERIRDALETSSPKLFFVGAAIEQAMAREIFAQLQDGRLDKAANFTKREQLKDVAGWLVQL